MPSLEPFFEILQTDPVAANELALKLLESCPELPDRDKINWARGYALVEAGHFGEARALYEDIYRRTSDHKALHQIGFVERSAGNLQKALEIFKAETCLIPETDRLALSVNLYELAQVSLLLNDHPSTGEYLSRYSAIRTDNADLIEAACFHRLKGDFFKLSDRALAEIEWQKSLEYFTKAQDSVGVAEIQQRLSAR